MNAELARRRDKEHLLARSALCRMQLRRQARSVRESLRWRQLAAAAVAVPATYRVGFGLSDDEHSRSMARPAWRGKKKG